MIRKISRLGGVLTVVLLILVGCATEKQKAYENVARQSLRVIATSQALYQKHFDTVAPDAATLDAKKLFYDPMFPQAFQQAGDNGDPVKPIPMHGYIYTMYTDGKEGYLVLARPTAPEMGRYQYVCHNGNCWKRLDPSPGNFFFTSYVPTFDFADQGWEKDNRES